MATPYRCARWATIRLATDPTRVRLPAKVEPMATTSQARCGSCKPATNGFRTSTAGTLLTTFDRTAVTPASAGKDCKWSRPIAAVVSGVRTACAADLDRLTPINGHVRPRQASSKAVPIPFFLASGLTAVGPKKLRHVGSWQANPTILRSLEDISDGDSPWSLVSPRCALVSA
jgi:hypothetical protein